MYKKNWKNVRKVNDVFELEAEPIEKSSCASRVNFTHVTFNCTGEHFVATDTAGYLYYIVLLNDTPTYEKLGYVGRATFVAFNPTQKYEILVGITTADIKVIRVNNQLVQHGVLIAHKIPPVQVSFYKTYCLTSSRKEGIIWCLKSCSQVRQLHVNIRDPVIKKASFSNLGHIVVLYYNDNFQIWNFNKLENDIKIDTKIFGVRSIRDFIFTQNGRAMIAVSAQNKFIIFNTCNWNVIKILNLPNTFIGVKQILPVPTPLDGGANNIIICISSSSNLHFFDLNQSCFIHTIHHVKPIKTIAVSPSGRHLVYVEKEGYLKLITAEKLFKQKAKYVQKLIEPCKSLTHGITDHLQFVKQSINQELHLERLLLILKEFGEYPEEYRVLIWSTILKLPGNKVAYNNLANAAASTNFTLDILKNFSLASRNKKSLLMTTIHCLIQWCPLLAQCTFLPHLVFPFLMIFQKDHLLGFEIILSMLLNYCQKWFEYYPLPPLNVLGIIENILLRADPVLLNVFCERGITSTEYAWPLLKTMMSEVLVGTEWLILWDHLISFKKVSLFLMSVVAYSICSRQIIITSLNTQEQIKKYFTRQGHIAAQTILKLAQKLDSNIPLRLHPTHYFRNETISLPDTGPYPPFVLEDFPTFLADETSLTELQKLKECERIRRKNNCRIMKIAEANRLNHEAKNFMNYIHQMRLNEAQQCLTAEVSNVKWRSKTCDQQMDVATTRNDSYSEQINNIPQLNLNTISTKNNVNIEKLKHYKQLQDDVDKLEYEVQSFLSDIRFQKSRLVTT